MTRDEGHLVRLMVEYQAGKIEAFEDLYESLAGNLARHFESVSPVRATAPDLVQETFMEIHRARRTYLPPLPVRPWVFGIARNVLRRHRRTAWRRARYEQPGGDLASDREPSATVALSGRIGAAEVDDALRRLPGSPRDAWELHHVEGFSFEEISRRLGIPVNAAKLRSSRAMGILRGLLGIERKGPRD